MGIGYQSSRSFIQGQGILLVWLIQLSPDSIQSIACRLHFPNCLNEAIVAGSKLKNILPGLENTSPSKVVEQLDPMPLETIFATYQATKSESLRQVLSAYATHWRLVKPIATGKTLQKLGLSPSPQYRIILKTLRDAWLNGTIHNAEEENTLLENILVWK